MRVLAGIVGAREIGAQFRFVPEVAPVGPLPGVDPIAEHPARVAQQLCKRRRRDIGRKPIDVFASGIVEPHGASLDELHDPDRRKRLRMRHRCLGDRRTPVRPLATS
jgi:hypothetical protein